MSRTWLILDKTTCSTSGSTILDIAAIHPSELTGRPNYCPEPGSREISGELSRPKPVFRKSRVS